MVENFFGWVIDPDRGVQLFSWHHGLYVFFAVLAVFLPLRYARAIKESVHEARFRHWAFVWLLVLEIVYHTHNWMHGMFSLPLHICSFAVVMNLALLKTNSHKVFEYVFFFGVLGGLMALLIPFTYGFPYYNIRYHLFILMHMTIIVIPLYYYKAYGFRVNLRATYKTFFMVLLTIPIVFNLNRFFNAVGLSQEPINYWYVTEIPEHVAFVFGDYHVIYLGAFVSVIYLSQMILYKVSNRNRNSVSSS